MFHLTVCCIILNKLYTIFIEREKIILRELNRDIRAKNRGERRATNIFVVGFQAGMLTGCSYFEMCLDIHRKHILENTVILSGGICIYNPNKTACTLEEKPKIVKELSLLDYVYSSDLMRLGGRF